MKYFPYLITLFILIITTLGVKAQSDTLRVGIAGSAPFVISEDALNEGISVEIWEAIAEELNIPYTFSHFDDVPKALDQLEKKKVDMIVGPVSILSDRAKLFRFTQPYYFSSISIASKANRSGLWSHISPFFSKSFFVAASIFLFILTIVGTLVWFAERNSSPDHFSPHDPLKGIANGVWFALVTMTTVGYGDMAPKTLAGKVIAGIWMVIALIITTSLIAGIASTLTIGGLSSSEISTAEGMNSKRIAVIKNSPAEKLILQYNGNAVPVLSLEDAFQLLEDEKVDAVTYDRPQIMYYLKSHPGNNVVLSTTEYMPQRYGFALPKDSELVSIINISLLHFQEDGTIDDINNKWLSEVNASK